MTGESMPGENLSLQGADGETIAAQKEDPGALTSHPRWQRMIIGVAGPFANFVLALGLMTGFLHAAQRSAALRRPAHSTGLGDSRISGGQRRIDGRGYHCQFRTGQKKPSWEQVYEHTALNLQSQNISHSVPVVVERNGQQVTTTLPLSDGTPASRAAADFTLDKIGLLPVIQPGPVKVSSVNDASPASKAGMQSGDQILSIDGHQFHGTPTIVAYLQDRKGAPVTVELEHAGKASPVVIQPRLDQGPDGSAWHIGFMGAPPPSRIEQMPFPKAVKASVKFSRENSLLILEVLKRLLTHRMSVNTLSSPIGIAQQTGMAAETPGWEAQVPHHGCA